jgi:hypothetical protein
MVRRDLEGRDESFNGFDAMLVATLRQEERVAVSSCARGNNLSARRIAEQMMGFTATTASCIWHGACISHVRGTGIERRCCSLCFRRRPASI